MRPVLVVVTDFGRVAALSRISRLLDATRPNTVLVQLRDHELPIRRRFELGLELRKLTRDRNQYFSVNDRVDLALALGADALHLGEASIDSVDARTLAAGCWISRACHQTRDVSSMDADAILLSPIIDARHGRPALGVSALGEAQRLLAGSSRGPMLFALGGVSADTARACVDAGADGVAVTGAVLDGDDATPLLEALDIQR